MALTVVKLDMNLKRYFIYWLKNNSLTLQSLITDRFSSILFIFGKILRLGFMVGFLLTIKDKINLVAGYSVDQLINFFLIFNLFDTFSQFFYRGIYWFRSDILSGDLDFKLLKPINPLFQVLTSHTDFLDLPVLLIIIISLLFRLPKMDLVLALNFSLLSLISLLIITAVHIFVAAIGVITTEVDHIIWIFRGISGMAQIPVDVYSEVVRMILTFVIPAGLIYTYPAKSLYGLLSSSAIIGAFVFGLVFYLLSLKFWNYSLKLYSSASS